MSTSVKNKVQNKRAKDSIDIVIYEKNLRIANVLPVKKQDSLIVFLNNNKYVSIHLSSYPRLKSASQKNLDNWALISNGIGIEWPGLDEDLSLKGLIQQFIKESTLNFISGGENTIAMAA